jgi:acetyl-CoA acyltransferase
MKQVQDAYIVAATRTPIGRSHRGFFRNMRPDDLLAATLKAALAQVPGLDPAAIEDVVCGCAIPEGAQGLNVARIGAVLAGLPTSVGGITVNRFCASGLSAVQMAADRIRVGEADVMIAAGVESMSMVPMMGNTPSLSPSIFLQDENVGIAYGMGLTAERWRGSGRCRARRRTPSRCSRTSAPSVPSRPASLPTRSRPSR